MGRRKRQTKRTFVWGTGRKGTVRSLFGAAALMLLTGGCSSPGDRETDTPPRYEEHMDISVAYWQIDEFLKNREEDEVLQKLEAEFNITIVPRNITWDDHYTKLQLWAETGDLPDLFAGDFRFGSSYYQWAREGLLHEIPSDLSSFPNLEIYLDNPETEYCKVDDKVYCIFRQTYSEQAETVKDRTIAYRWDLAQKAGITKEPENWQEFREMILAIIEADSEGTGISGMTAKDYNMIMGPLFTYSIPLASNGGTNFYWVPQERDAEGTASDRYVPAIFAGKELGSDALATWQLIRDMYQEGVIEQDIFLATTAQAEEKFLMGRSAAICFDGGVSNTKTYENIIQYWKEIHGSEFLEDVRFLDLMPSVDGETYYTVWDYAWSESYISAAVSDEKLERILAIYDYLLSEEGMLLSHFGLEGESYCVEEDGSIRLLGEEAPSDRYLSIGMLASLVSWNNGIQDGAKYPSTVPEAYRKVDEERVERARQCGIPEYDYEYTAAVHQMDDPFSIDANAIFQEIMLGKEPVEEVWKAIIGEYKKQGLMEVIEEVNRRVQQS